MTFFFKSTKTSEVMQTSGALLEAVEIEIKATEEVLKKYRNNGYMSAVTCTREMASYKKKEAEDESCEMSHKDQFKANFFLPLINQAICSLIDRFEQMHAVGAIFDFL